MKCDHRFIENKKPPDFSGGFCVSIGNRNSKIVNQ